MPLDELRWVHKAIYRVLCASAHRGYKNLGEKSRTTLLVFATNRPLSALAQTVQDKVHLRRRERDKMSSSQTLREKVT